MAIIKKFSPFTNLSNFQVFLNDSGQNSDYFRVTEFENTLTGGKNGFLIEGSEFLKESTEVKIELLDVEGNPIYFEPGDGTPEYYEGTSKLISVHVYDDTPIGQGKITILGELKNYIDDVGATVPIPDEWKGIYNVKWERTFQVNKNLNNETIVRFYKRPVVSITELVKPIFTKSIPSVTDTGTVHGISEVPIDGTDIRDWRAGTLYKLLKNSGSWDRDVDENIITITNPSHEARIIEVLNDTEVIVDIPYTSNNIVSNFTSGSYSVTYSDFQNEIIGESTLTGSFAKIDISQLKTFVGDVARVKVFRKSRNAVGDFQFVQESKLESTELLRDITTPSNTEIPYGRFDESNLETYWVTSSDDHPISIDSSKLSQAVKFDYNVSAGGTQRLITSQSLSISKDVEYTLNFKTLLSGSLSDSEKNIKAFFSSSNFTQDFLTVSGSAIYRTRQNLSQNIISENSGSAKLVFEVTGDDWYISNVSLKNAQDTSFSPDEFVLIQDIPRKLASETFDFRFEFYDINNNYIPVDVSAVGVFDGGNDFPTSGKLLTFESDRNAFRFTSGSLASPSFQQLQFKLTQNNLTGSPTFASAAFDVDGNYIEPSSYAGDYPGLLTNVTPAGAILTVANFSGSVGSTTVGSIVYTASLEDLEEFETVYRLEDGDNAPTLLVTSNANQFIYEPTSLTPKPEGQSITIRAQRKNLASLVTPITVNSGSNTPPLTFVDTVGGIDTYTISATAFSESFSANSFDEVTYDFTGSDVFGVEQYDEITLSKVINFDGVSLVLSNESTTFPAKSTGEVIQGFASSIGTVQMFIGGSQISHDDLSGGRDKNTFDITSVTGTNVTPISTSPTTNEYGITQFPDANDSGSLVLDIEYLAGDNETSQSFQKIVSYTKSKAAVPNVVVEGTPVAQALIANSVGSGSVSPETITFTALEGGTSRFDSIGNPTYSGGLTGSISTNTITFSDTVSDMTSETETIEVPITFTDSEGTTSTKNTSVSISRVRRTQPVVTLQSTPVAQTVDANSAGTLTGTIQDITISAFEGGTLMNYNSTSTLSAGDYKITNITHNQASVSDVTFVTTTPSTAVIEVSSLAATVTNALITATVQYKDSEGTLGSQTVQFSVAKLSDATAGIIIEADPQSQTVNSNADFSTIGTPSEVLIKVYEDGSLLEYDSVSSYTNGSFRITNTSGGTLNETEGATSASVQPTTPTDDTGQQCFVDVVVTDSAGTELTSRRKSFDVGVSVTGDTGVDGVSVTPSISNQNVVRTNTGTFGTPLSIFVTVVQGSTVFEYDDTTPYANSSFRITNIGEGTDESTNGAESGSIIPTTPTTVSGVTTTYDVIYKDSNGSSTTQSFTHQTTVTLDGNTGPGIVHTGEWVSGRAYQFSNGNSGNPGTARRDTVLYNGTYYAATSQHTSTASGTNGPPGVGSNWESLGTQDLFVAAKIAVFEESFIQNTLNIGTNNNGGVDTANITLYGGGQDPYFSLGQATQGVYGDEGIFIGKDTILSTDYYRMSLHNGGTGTGEKYLKWTGSDLEIKGNITADTGTFSGTVNASGGTFTNNITTSGTFTSGTSKFGTGVASGKNGIIIDSDNYWYYDTSTNDVDFKVGDSTDNITWDGSTLSVSGDLDASSGTITGATLVGGSIAVPSSSSPTFQVSAAGVMSATGASITGNITATSGVIGGWTVGNNQLYSPASTTTNRMTLTAGGSPEITIYNNNGQVATQINSQTSLSSGIGSTPTISSTSISQPSGNTSSFVQVNSGVTNYTVSMFGGNSAYGTPNSTIHWDSSKYSSISNLANGTATIEATQVPTALLNYIFRLNQQSGQTFQNASGIVKMGFLVQTGSPTGISGVVGYHEFTYLEYAQNSTKFTVPSYSISSNTGTVSFTASAGTTYYLIPYLRGVSINVYRGSNYQTIYYTTTHRIPPTTNISASQPVSRTEICAGGLQVISSSANKVVMERNTSASGAGSVMLEVAGSIEASGNITANTSDKRLKDILGKIDSPINKLKKLNGIIYKNNELSKKFDVYEDRIQVGLLAQEVQKVLPEAVTRAPFDTEKDSEGKPYKSKTGDDYLTIWYERVVPLLVEGIKELSERLELVEEENKKLKEDGNNRK